jgi:D-alanyl-D-alanine carboxypeptidase
LARYALSIPLIQAATTKKEYPFTMLGSGKKHTIKNLNKLLSSGWLVQGTKTGYTEEARYCLAAQVQGKLSKKIMLVVVLGSVSDARRYDDMDKVLHASYP